MRPRQSWGSRWFSSHCLGSGRSTADAQALGVPCPAPQDTTEKPLESDHQVVPDRGNPNSTPRSGMEFCLYTQVSVGVWLPGQLWPAPFLTTKHEAVGLLCPPSGTTSGFLDLIGRLCGQTSQSMAQRNVSSLGQEKMELGAHFLLAADLHCSLFPLHLTLPLPAAVNSPPLAVASLVFYVTVGRDIIFLYMVFPLMIIRKRGFGNLLLGRNGGKCQRENKNHPSPTPQRK